MIKIHYYDAEFFRDERSTFLIKEVNRPIYYIPIIGYSEDQYYILEDYLEYEINPINNGSIIRCGPSNMINYPKLIGNDSLLQKAKEIFGDIIIKAYVFIKNRPTEENTSHIILEQYGDDVVFEFINGKKVLFTMDEWGSIESFK